MHCNQILSNPESKSSFKLIHEQIFHLVKKGEDSEGYNTLIEEIKKNNPVQPTYVLKTIAYELGATGNIERVLNFFKKLTTDPEHSIHTDRFLRNAVAGFAKSNLKELAFQFLEKITLEYPANMKEDLFEELVYRFATYKHVSETYAILEELKDKYPSELSKLLNGIGAGFAIGGYTRETFAFINKIKDIYPREMPDLLSEVAYAFTFHNHEMGIDRILKDIKNTYPKDLDLAISDTSRGLARHRHKKEIYAFLEKIMAEYPMHVTSAVEGCANGLNQINRCIDKFIVLKVLTLTKDYDSRVQIAMQIKKYVNKYDVLGLIPEANKFSQLMARTDMTYAQVLASFQSEMRIFILQGIQLVHEKKLINSTFLLIATFLSPMTLPEVCDLSNKLALKIHHQRFFNNLKNQGLRLLLTDGSMERPETRKRKCRM